MWKGADAVYFAVCAPLLTCTESWVCLEGQMQETSAMIHVMQRAWIIQKISYLLKKKLTYTVATTWLLGPQMHM